MHRKSLRKCSKTADKKTSSLLYKQGGRYYFAVAKVFYNYSDSWRYAKLCMHDLFTLIHSLISEKIYAV